VTAEIVERVRRSVRYRDVDAALVARLAAEELPRARNADDAVKRVKRRLHQAVGAFRGSVRPDLLAAVRDAWRDDLADPAFRAASARLLAAHASTRERVPHLDRFFERIWETTGRPATLMDLGCGLGPVMLPWMGLDRGATILALDADERPLATVGAFMKLVGQPHRLSVIDLATDAPRDAADVALMLKLVTTLDRQDPAAATRLLSGLRASHAVVSFAARSLGGRGDGRERTYRERLARLVGEAGRVRAVAEASVPNELVFVLTLDAADG
jgi:16S rRNA (guanine(1405)-N(7))-methyltransferase